MKCQLTSRAHAKRALLDDEVNTNVLMALDRFAVLGGGEKTPVVQRREQQLIQTRLLRRLQKFDIDGAVRVNREARKRNGVIRGFAQVVRNFRQWLRDCTSARMAATVGGEIGCGR